MYKAGDRFHHTREGVTYRYMVLGVLPAPTPQHNDWFQLLDLDADHTILVESEWFNQRNIKPGA